MVEDERGQCQKPDAPSVFSMWWAVSQISRASPFAFPALEQRPGSEVEQPDTHQELSGISVYHEAL